MNKHIRLKQLQVSYPLITGESTSLKSTVLSALKGKRVVVEEHKALNNISLDIREGDRICLIGSNGAGKSTLLRTLAGILTPLSGSITVEGNISSLLDFATGFEMEMTGYENIIIRGMLLGMTRSEILNKRDAIAEFAELGDFINQPIKTYSSGMFVRLAFAVATSIEPDILIIDEIVGAGDASFTEKANARMEMMLDKGSIIVMATHSTELALRLCNRAIWLDKGNIVMDGKVSEVLEEYLNGKV
ncbi:ABC transporter ATP-binding protein [Pontibacterium sp.]|uniref:ABC transporter ATP-binding protein n=1 Tax=Pontibacterium sp. TaxID=2036026 RepID=UPI003514CDAA